MCIIAVKEWSMCLSYLLLNKRSSSTGNFMNMDLDLDFFRSTSGFRRLNLLRKAEQSLKTNQENLSFDE